MGVEMKTMLSKVLISAIIIIIFLDSGCINSEDDGGAEGDLALEISLDQYMMTEDQSITLEFKVINNGITKLRVLFPNWFMEDRLIIVKDENGMALNCIVEYEPPPPVENSDLRELEPDDYYIRDFEISKYIWDFESGNNYSIQGRFSDYKYPELSKLYWRGEIYSNIVNLEVI
jgi:hypothetical protein